MKMNSFQVFISHATADRELAIAIKDCIAYALRFHEKDRNIFCSSDTTSMEMGKVDVVQVTEGHKQAKVVVALMTPNSIYRPWVIYEAGGAHFHDAKQLFVTVANGATVECLPAPLQWWHIGSLVEPQCIKNLCVLIAKALKRNRKVRALGKKRVETIVKLAKQFSGDWDSVGPALTAGKLATSPFNVRHLLDKRSPNNAKQEVYLIGQHLLGITKSKGFFGDYKTAIFEWLRADSSRKFTVMISDVRYRVGVDPWNLIYNPNFKSELKRSTKALRQWVKNAQHEGLSFVVQVAKFVPIGATFIDPDTPTGLMILKPVVYETGSVERPQFVLNKKQNIYVFEHYWSSFQKILGKAPELK